MIEPFESLESNVRVYCRSFPTVFRKARGSELWDVSGKRFIDLFAGAGTMNYGHNPEAIKCDLLAYINKDGITHSLDMYSEAKAEFIQAFQTHILSPRGLGYRFMFPGPTGTNAVEAALKLARKVTGRSTVAAFTDGFHGMSLGALAATGSAFKRGGAGIALTGVQRFPYEAYHGPSIDTIDLISRLLDDPSSGYDAPAAFLVETIQGEGGIHTASPNWLRRLAGLAKRHDSLLIVDDIQAGCGRAGTFFSFEESGVKPDIVCLSKALSGYGLPFSLVLLKPDIDVWRPGEHNGTFRGNNLAFVTGRSAILNHWRDDSLGTAMLASSKLLDAWLKDTALRLSLGPAAVRGKNLLKGLVLPSGDIADKVVFEAFCRGVIIETSGGEGEVLKFLPPLIISPSLLGEALNRLDDALSAGLETKRFAVRATA
ncbi:diaminobutyrate--2-oxoglutarate transaminase [uncultured Bradyrhizobium sp.]|uniref:diaminobutyrate--2-oxoglutarate transaminase n=1 Tax=uncultured Bradyrhizobium sp. TaxID=199684 RepID=UPI0035C9C73F